MAKGQAATAEQVRGVVEKLIQLAAAADLKELTYILEMARLEASNVASAGLRKRAPSSSVAAKGEKVDAE